MSMVPHEPGTRVVAVRDADEEVVNIFGFGTYVGDELPPAKAAEVIAFIPEAQRIDREIVDEGVDVLVEHEKAMIAVLHKLAGDAAPPPPSEEDMRQRAEETIAEARNRIETYTTDEYARWIGEQSPMFSNPRIDLDSGDTVWGYQCWWGPIESEEWWRETYVKGRRVETVPVPA